MNFYNSVTGDLPPLELEINPDKLVRLQKIATFVTTTEKAPKKVKISRRNKNADPLEEMMRQQEKDDLKIM